MSCPPTLLSPSYAKSLLTIIPTPRNPPRVISVVKELSLQPHPEGGFFVETDRDPRMVPNPFLDDTVVNDGTDAHPIPNGITDSKRYDDGENDPNSAAYNFSLANKSSIDRLRHASTSIHYFLAPSSPLGRFHRNKARTVHTLHWGRGFYVVLHPPDLNRGGDGGGNGGGKWKVETFAVGHDVEKGEKVQWIVEGGRYKASYLLADSSSESVKGGESERGLLISETVVPGFEYSDHDFLTAEGFLTIVGSQGAGEMGWLLGREEGGG